jgi:glutamate-1-semialdehyde 2,1-aminomutase
MTDSRRSVTQSIFAFEAARQRIPGGVNSPVRAFRAVGGSPVFIERAHGSRLIDVDDNSYIDHVMSWGALILGHASPSVVEAIMRAASLGTSYGAPTKAETELAELVCTRLPSVERIRFVSSGTEATMSAVRLARGFTKRNLIVKFAGCYHGHSDGFLISAGSGALTNGVPSSPGVSAAAVAETLVVPYNDVDAISALFAEYPERIAAVIVEPYAGNMGMVVPKPGYLHHLRDITAADGALLIFDEVMTGFRVDRGGVQTRERIVPDLTTLGKILGGGLPIAAFGGKAEIMALLSPEGPVYQAGTLSGNPLATAAGIATLQALDAPGLYDRLEATGKRFIEGLGERFKRYKVPHVTTQVGSMTGFFFTQGPVTDLESAQQSDTAFYAEFFHAMLARGVYFAPSQFEAGFLSLAHNDATIDATLHAVEESLDFLKNAKPAVSSRK